ncbi:hypothetical protein [Teredinibacter purpureus]|nr:hypothetical protein [Teredinibacter purpureus]
MHDYLEELLYNNGQNLGDDWDSDAQESDIDEEDEIDECESF